MLVMKFGGTSVEDAPAIERVAGIVRSRMRRRPVVVVSAFHGVTDQLLTLGQTAACGDGESALAQMRGLRQRHYDTARELLGEDHFRGMRLKLDPQFEVLEQFTRGIAAIRELSARSTDYLLSFGELMSSQIVASALSARGLPAVWLDSREYILTNGDFTRATPHYSDTYDRMRAGIRPLLINQQLPVLAGFISATRDGIATTLGRGGSDFSAALIAAGINASSIEIWTDVDGIMTTDPSLCPQAHCLRRVSFREAQEMAHFGAKVLHPATLVPAMEKNIPVLVLNSRNPKSPGTRITSQPPRGRSVFTAIAARKNISTVTLTAPRESAPHWFLQEVFHILHRSACGADLVAVSEASVSFTLRTGQSTDDLLANLQEIAAVTVEDKQAIVCLLGENIRGRAGIAARAFTALGDAGINVRMISQGASEISLSFVIHERDVTEAVRRLHARFAPEKNIHRRRAQRKPRRIAVESPLQSDSVGTPDAAPADQSPGF
jgi:aspartate kinase